MVGFKVSGGKGSRARGCARAARVPLQIDFALALDAGIEDGDIARNLRHALVPVGLVGAVLVDSVMASGDHRSAHAEWAVVFFGVLNTALDNTRVRVISEQTGGAIKTSLARV